VPEKATNFTKTCRYFSLIQTRHLPPKNTFKKARAMYIVECDDFIFGKASKNAKHLRSITVEYVRTSALTAILQTKNVRYLNISGLKYETLPEVISEIWSLQALHVTFSDLVKLPDSIGKLQKLRVVNLSYCRSLASLPDSIGNCVMISRIDLFGCEKVTTLPSTISRNKRLRVLRLGHTIIERLPSSITSLENLKCLDLHGCSELIELPESIGNLRKLVVLNLEECGKLQAIPKGIAQLTRLEKLGLFVMVEDESYAQISELRNVNRISGELSICGIAHGMDPDIAHKECLKLKTNLQSLRLVCASVRLNSENQFEGLEPPSIIKRIKIVGYPGQESMQWMLKHRGAEVAGFPRFRLLSELELSDFPKLERLEGLTELPCLEKLVLKKMTAVKSISGGPFPKLLEFVIRGMPKLGVVWMVTGGSLADVEGGQVQIGNCLAVLRIFECPKLLMMPYFPLSLKDLSLVRSNVQLLGLPGLDQRSSLPSSSAGLPSFSFSCLKNLNLIGMPPPTAPALYGFGYRWELLQHLMALESLQIWSCDGLTELPESMRSLASLRTLEIVSCQTLCMLPEWLGEVQYLESMNIWVCHNLSPAPSMQPLKALKSLNVFDSGWVGDLGSPSLQTLSIQGCDNISSHPQSFRQLTSLTNLKITRCRDFHQLLKYLGELRSLQMLYIMELSRLSSLPQSLGYLSSLQELQIIRCDALGQRPECVGQLCSLHVFGIWGLPSLTCLPQSLGRLTSLQVLTIGNCEALDQLPESLGELCSLSKFELWGLLGLTSFPKSVCFLTSLEQLTITSCPGIRSLAEWIKGLTALQTLDISGCPDLERRCERRKGKDWHLISHIPHLWIGRVDDHYRFIW
jgi:Leucine-rich repeat (LRR) protein